MRVDLLGAVRVTVDEEVIALRSAAQRSIIAMLAAHVPAEVSHDRLIDAVWGADPPGRPLATLQIQVSRLRSRLPDGVIETTSSGYRLAADSVHIDMLHFRSLVSAAEMRSLATDRDERISVLALLREGEALWRGEVLDDVRDEWTEPFVVELNAARTAALECAFEIRIGLGGDVDLIADLERSTSENPLNERLTEWLMLSLYRSGRTADALNRYGEFRRRLVDQLGLRPSKRLTDLELSILTDDSLALPPKALDSLRGVRPPATATSFVGRVDELDELRCAVEGHRLVTLLGPGGVGKSRLVSEAFDWIDTSSPHRAWFVSLAELTSGELVASHLAGVLGIDATGGSDATSSVIRVVKDWACTLVLDNCENTVKATAELVHRILRECPSVSIVATSREPLRIEGERAVRLGGLKLGGESGDADAEALFIERADLVEHAPFDTSDVRHLCTILDGWPLAIELVAANLETKPLQLIARDLETQMVNLKSPFRFTTDRHRSLTAALDWSYRLLPEELQRAYRALGVFDGQITFEACASVVDAGPQAPRALLGDLVDRSLLVPSLPNANAVRMLRPVVQHARRLLEQNPQECTKVTHRFVDHIVHYVADADARIDGADAEIVIHDLAAEESNVIRAIDDATSFGQYNTAASMLKLLAYYWMLRSLQPAGEAMIEAFISRFADELDHERHADLLQAAGFLSGSRGDYGAAATSLQACLKLQRAHHDPAIMITTNNMCIVIEQQLRLREALGLLDYAESIADDYYAVASPERALTAEWGLAVLRSDLLALLGEAGSASGHARRALDIADSRDNARQQITALIALATAELNNGSETPKCEHLERAERSSVKLDGFGLNEIHVLKARRALVADDLDDAERHIEASITAIADHDHLALTHLLVWRAEVEHRQGDHAAFHSTLRRALDLAIDGEYGIPSIGLLHQSAAALRQSDRHEQAATIARMVASIEHNTGVVVPAGMKIDHPGPPNKAGAHAVTTFLEAVRHARGLLSSAARTSA